MRHDHAFTGRNRIGSVAPMNEPRRPVFLSETIDAALDGKSADEQLTILAEIIREAQSDKDEGRGPPQSELIAARRKWLALFDALYARETDDEIDF